MWYERIVERDLVPDPVLRRAVRMRLARLLDRLEQDAGGDGTAAVRRLAAGLRRQPIVLHADAANRQHYEVPTEFFAAFLGPRLKYSACLWPPGVEEIGGAEEAMLSLTCERAGIADGMEIMDLGCGWGSLSLYVAERYPRSRVLAVSNSRTQGEHIAAEARRRGFDNLAHVVAEVGRFSPGRRFDRVVSVEMFEHVRNYEVAFRRLRGWLREDGMAFLHVFAHRTFPYVFSGEPDDWMGRTFFSGGTMPSHDLFLEFQRDLELVDRWRVDGMHYARTLEDWLASFDAREERISPLLVRTYGDDARRWRANWRLFFIACAETFAYDEGRQWGVSHYLFKPRTGRSGRSAA